MKNNLLVDEFMNVLFLSETYPGSVNDKRIADSTPYPLPEGSYLLEDLGFMGFELPGVEFIMPHKKPPGGELSMEEKAANHDVSRIRVRIEHVLSSIKRCRIVKETFRLFKKGAIDRVMDFCCALHNLRLKHAPWGSMV